MTIEQMIAAVRASMAALLTTRATHEQTITTVRGALGADGQPNAQQSEQVRTAEEGLRSIDDQLATMTARESELLEQQTRDAAAAAMRLRLGQGNEDQRAPGRVTNEERTYSARKDSRGEASFFVDSYRGFQMGDMSARSRLERHAVEVEREGRLTERAVSTGGLGSLVVPQYLVDLAASVIRSGRPVANSVTGLSLPSQGMTITLPRGTTGAAVAAQALENTALQNTDEAWADLQIPVRTIGGQQDLSRQSLERGTPGIDEIVYLDLAGTYHAEVDRQVLNGSGASGQMLGILQTAGILAGTAFGAPITAANFNMKLAGLIANIAGVGRGITPRLSVMNPRRWGWLTGLTDSTGKPLVNFGPPGTYTGLGINSSPGGYSGDPNDRTVTTVGTVQGLPVITDANVPTNLGTLNEDPVVSYDANHALLWEDGDGQPRQLRFEQTLGQNLTVKLVVYGYCAFTAARYPQAFGKFGGLDTAAGNGLVAPTF